MTRYQTAEYTLAGRDLPAHAGPALVADKATHKMGAGTHGNVWHAYLLQSSQRSSYLPCSPPVAPLRHEEDSPDTLAHAPSNTPCGPASQYHFCILLLISYTRLRGEHVWAGTVLVNCPASIGPQEIIHHPVRFNFVCWRAACVRHARCTPALSMHMNLATDVSEKTRLPIVLNLCRMPKEALTFLVQVTCSSKPVREARACSFLHSL